MRSRPPRPRKTHSDRAQEEQEEASSWARAWWGSPVLAQLVLGADLVQSAGWLVVCHAELCSLHKGPVQ